MKALKISKIWIFVSIIIISLNFKDKEPTYQDLKELWKQVDEYERRELPKSALNTLDIIYELVKKEADNPEMLKCIMYNIRLNNQRENNALPKLIKYTENQLQYFDKVGKSVLNSLLAEMYWKYYEQNRWRIQNKTAIKNSDEKDITNWTYADFVKITNQKYTLSLNAMQALQQTLTTKYKTIIIEGNAHNERPTLYDLLINRAIDFYKNNEANLSFTGKDLNLNTEAVFDTPETFIDFNFSALPNDLPQTQVLKLLKDWLQFRLADSTNTAALFYANLLRLQYVKHVSSRLDADELYFEALNRLQKTLLNDTLKAEITLEQAKYYISKTNGFDQKKLAQSKFAKNKILTHKLLQPLTEDSLPIAIKNSAKSILLSIESESFNLIHSEVVIPTQQIPVYLQYKNINKIYYKIHKVEQLNMLKHTRNRYHKDYYNTLILSGKKILESSMSIPEFKDYLEHSTEFILDALPIGYYIISYSDSETFNPETDAISYSQIQVSNLAYIDRNTANGDADFFIAHRESGEPLNNIEAQVIYQKYNYQSRSFEITMGKKFHTNEDGFIKITNLDNSRNNNFLLQLVQNNDTLFTNDAHTYNIYDRRPNIRVYLFTDRAIYRPGQTVYYKGLVVEKASNKLPVIFPKYSSSVKLKDANWKEVSTTNFTTNEYGTFSGSFIIPKASLNGQMTLYTPIGQKYIQVEEYKRPTFSIEINEPKGQLKLDSNIEISGSVMRFNGTPGSQATIKYRIIRTPQFSWWWRQMNSEKQINFGETTANAKGEFQFSFTAFSGMKKPGPNTQFTYKIEIDATDSNGETQSDSKHITLGNQPLTLAISTKKSYTVQETKSISLSVKNSNNQDEKASVTLSVAKLESPTKAIIEKPWPDGDTVFQNIDHCIPEVLYLDKDYLKKLKTETTILEQEITIKGDSVINFENIKNWESGYYRIQVVSMDAFENRIKKEAYFSVIDSKSKKVQFPQLFFANTEAETLEPGENVSLTLGSSEKIKVLYYVEFQGKIIHSETLALKNKTQQINYPVTETLRGGFTLHFTFIYKGQFFNYSKAVKVPFSNKQLKITYETFRNKVKPGDTENWTLKIEGSKGEKIASEIMASMYDKSLDEFINNEWSLNLYLQNSHYQLWNEGKFDTQSSIFAYRKKADYPIVPVKTYDQINWHYAFDFYHSYIYKNNTATGGTVSHAMPQRQALSEVALVDDDIEIEDTEVEEAEVFSIIEEEKPKEIQVREKFNETAFFYPHLHTDENGLVNINFALPESLTTWKFQTLAHSKNLEVGISRQEIVAQKELMVEISAPRFVTQGDKITIPAKIQNLTDKNLVGEVELSLSNPLTGFSYNSLIQNKNIKQFSCNAKDEMIENWELVIPDTIQALQYKVIAKTANHTDGEQKWIPVLASKVLVTETQPLWVNETETRNFEFEGLKNSNSSSTLTHHKLTFEFSSNPTWYAIQALPYLLEKESNCTEQIFNAYYATEIARFVIESNPKIATVFKAWKASDNDETFLSNLEKNEELKQVLLNETPWVFDALNEKEQKQKMALLFDQNYLEMHREASLYLLRKLQQRSGAWPWFDGMSESRYVTQYLLTGFGKLKQLGIISDKNNSAMLDAMRQGMYYLDKKMDEDYRWNLKHNPNSNHLSNLVAQYLYMRSFYPEIKNRYEEAYNYFTLHAKKNWTHINKYGQAMLALAFYRQDNTQTAQQIMASLKEYALTDEEQGMYWKENVSGYYWYQSPVEFQSIMIELFSEIDKNKNTQNELKKWLLKNKQTNNWESSRATADAIYALMSSGSNWIKTQPEVAINMGSLQITNQQYQAQAEPGTGYFKTTWNKNTIMPEMSKISISRKGEGISWGGVYWQYFEQIDQIKSAANDLKISKRIFKEMVTDNGLQLIEINETDKLEVGNTVVIRLDFETDRRMEYVHLKDNRAAAFEPHQTLSGYQYKSGLSFYQSTHDTSTDFFIEYLPVGSYTFEYRMNVTHLGTFSLGVANIQCMYAPEFNAHSKGMKIEVK